MWKNKEPTRVENTIFLHAFQLSLHFRVLFVSLSISPLSLSRLSHNSFSPRCSLYAAVFARCSLRLLSACQFGQVVACSLTRLPGRVRALSLSARAARSLTLCLCCALCSVCLSPALARSLRFLLLRSLNFFLPSAAAAQPHSAGIAFRFVSFRCMPFCSTMCTFVYARVYDS